jgi:glycolate oxidase iron-sulfur subunit
VDGPVHAAASRLLAALGYAVVVPDDQACCGAMHLHAGLAEEAGQLAEASGKAFSGLGLEAILVSATGCGAVLRGKGGALGAPAGDVLSFLARADWDALTARPLPARVAVHIPCSARDAGLAVGDVLGLLGRIPGMETIPLDPGLGCCGAAGTYLLHHATTADALREGVLDAIAASGAGMVVTANTGCAMHLRAGLVARGLAVRVAHPVELLAEASFGPAGEVP